MTTRWASFARGWVIAGFSTFVAALSHTLGGAHAPGWLGVVVSLAFAGVVCVGLAGPRISRARVSVSVVLSQLIFHGLFSLGAPGGTLSEVPSVGPAQHGTHVLSVAAGVGQSTYGDSGHSPWIWIAHAIAAAVTILALRHGGISVRRLQHHAQLAVRTLFTSVAKVPLTPATVTAHIVGRLFVPRPGGLLSSSVVRRGPPRLAASIV